MLPTKHYQIPVRFVGLWLLQQTGTFMRTDLCIFCEKQFCLFEIFCENCGGGPILQVVLVVAPEFSGSLTVRSSVAPSIPSEATKPAATAFAAFVKRL